MSVNNSVELPEGGPANSERLFTILVRSQAGLLGASCREQDGGWIIEIQKDNNRVLTYGYDFSLNNAASQLIAKDKAATSGLLLRRGLPCVEHHLVLRPQLAPYVGTPSSWQRLSRIFDDHGQDLVIKPNEGTSSGVGVVHIRSLLDLEARAMRIWSRHRGLAASRFVAIAKEWRAVVLDGKVRLLYEKQRNDTEWRHNLSLGARPKICTSEEFPEVVRLAVNAGSALGLRVCAVDIVESLGELEVLEINSGLMFENLIRQIPDVIDSVSMIYRDVLVRSLE